MNGNLHNTSIRSTQAINERANSRSNMHLFGDSSVMRNSYALIIAIYQLNLRLGLRRKMESIEEQRCDVKIIEQQLLSINDTIQSIFKQIKDGLMEEVEMEIFKAEPEVKLSKLNKNELQQQQIKTLQSSSSHPKYGSDIGISNNVKILIRTKKKIKDKKEIDSGKIKNSWCHLLQIQHLYYSCNERYAKISVRYLLEQAFRDIKGNKYYTEGNEDILIVGKRKRDQKHALFLVDSRETPYIVGIRENLPYNLKRLRDHCIKNNQLMVMGIETNLNEWIFTKYDGMKEANYYLEQSKKPNQKDLKLEIFDTYDNLNDMLGREGSPFWVGQKIQIEIFDHWNPDQMDKLINLLKRYAIEQKQR